VKVTDHHAPAALPPGKSLRHQLDRRLGGPHSRSGRCGEKKNLALARIRTPAILLLILLYYYYYYYYYYYVVGVQQTI
jgi:hypothetical protein